MGHLSLALWLAVRAAPASSDASPLRWSAPASCPDEAAVASRIEQLVGRRLDADIPRIEARVQALADGSAWRLEIAIGGDATAERRTVTAPTCEALGDVAALLVAVVAEPVQTASRSALDDFVVPEVASPDAQSPVVRRRAPSLRPIDRPEAVPRSPRDRSITGSLRLRGGAVIGALPGATGGLDLGVAIARGWLRGELVGAYAVPRRTDVRGRSLRVSLGTISPRLCGAMPQRRVGIVACVGPELGVMRGVSDEGVHQPLWVAAVVEFSARIALRRRLALWATGAASVPARFPVFRLRDTAGASVQVFRPGPAGGRLLLGLELTLGRRPKSP